MNTSDWALDEKYRRKLVPKIMLLLVMVDLAQGLDKKLEKGHNTY